MSNIRYFVVVPDGQTDLQRDVTPFQGFSLALKEHRFHFFLHVLSVLPHDAFEVFMDRGEINQIRQQSIPRDSTIIAARHLAEALASLSLEIAVVLCARTDLQIVRQASAAMKIKPIILSDSRAEDVVDILSRAPSPYFIDYQIRDRLNKVAKILGSKLHQGVLTKRQRKITYEHLNFPSRIAGVTRANEAVLLDLGYSFAGEENIKANSRSNYIDAISKSANDLLERIVDHGESRDFIIYSSAIYSFLYDFKQHHWNSILREVKDRAHREFIKNGIFLNPDYSGYASSTIRTALEENPYKDPVLGPVLSLRQAELALVAAGISQLTTSATIPAIRLPNSVNFHHFQLSEIDRLVGAADSKSHKLMQKNFKALLETIENEIPNELMEIISSRAEACTICSDAPIEWVRVEGIPLMIRNEVSRIPMTPGNLFLQLTMMGSPIRINAKSLNEILVLRSFEDSDPIKNDLHNAVCAYPLTHGVSLKFVDVTTINEVIQALNSHTGAIVVFDCHGAHDGRKDIGWLAIGRERLNSWELAHVARVPPIVLLSACFTSAVTGSHVSVANGFVRSGALAVLGAFFAVNSLPAAIMIGRLIYRVDSFLPALKALGFQLITWRKLVSTFFQMSYATDVLNYFAKQGLISKEKWREISYQANTDVNSLDVNWHENLINRISEASKLNSSEVRRHIREENPLMDTLMYCQIGRPEILEIFIDDEDCSEP